VIKKRDLSIALAVIVMFAALIYAGRRERRPILDRVGEVNLWPAVAVSGIAARPAAQDFPFRVDDQAEVLETGLQDVRGLACRDDDVYVAEGNGRVLKYPGNVRIVAPVTDAGEPVKIDLRGAAVHGDSLLLADFGRGIVVDRPAPPGDIREQAISGKEISGPCGIAVAADGALFVTDDRPWPKPGSEAAFETADYSRWLDKGSPRLFGSVFMFPAAAAPAPHSWTIVQTRLRHPSGIAAVGANGPVYLAEADDTEVRWPVIEWSGTEWVQRKALGSAPIEGKKLSPFLGVALSPQGRFIFAAGPKGLYVFSRTSMLGQMVFEEPVGGVAACGRTLYLTVGHRLCRIWLHKTA
jgi:hypothetical protein